MSGRILRHNSYMSNIQTLLWPSVQAHCLIEARQTSIVGSAAEQTGQANSQD